MKNIFKKIKKNMNKDFEDILKPMYYLTTICCVRKIGLKNHEMSLINKRDVIISVLANTGIVILYYITYKEFISKFFSTITSYIYVLAYVSLVIDHVILHVANFVQSKNNLALFLALREIYKHLSLRKQLKRIKFLLLLPCIACICGHLLLIVCKLSIDPLWVWSRGIFIFSSVIYDLEVIYSGFIVLFITNKMQIWAKIFRKVDIKIRNHEAVMRKMDKVYNMLIDAVIFNKKAFQLTVIN